MEGVREENAIDEVELKEDFEELKKRRGDHASVFKDVGVPLFRSTCQKLKVNSADQDKSYAINILAETHGFFYVEDNWTCYRRNYFKVLAGFKLTDSEGKQAKEFESLQITLEDGQTRLDVLNFRVAISSRAVGGGPLSGRIDIVQNTSKRDRGPQRIPDTFVVCPGARLSSAIPDESVATFERVQFKSSTASTKAAPYTLPGSQLYAQLAIELYAVCKGGVKHLVAIMETSPLVVRSRSPAHYDRSLGGASSETSLSPMQRARIACSASKSKLAEKRAKEAAATAAAQTGEKGSAVFLDVSGDARPEPSAASKSKGAVAPVVLMPTSTNLPIFPQIPSAPINSLPLAPGIKEHRPILQQNTLSSEPKLTAACLMPTGTITPPYLDRSSATPLLSGSSLPFSSSQTQMHPIANTSNTANLLSASALTGLVQANLSGLCNVEGISQLPTNLDAARLLSLQGSLSSQSGLMLHGGQAVHLPMGGSGMGPVFLHQARHNLMATSYPINGTNQGLSLTQNILPQMPLGSLNDTSSQLLTPSVSPQSELLTLLPYTPKPQTQTAQPVLNNATVSSLDPWNYTRLLSSPSMPMTSTPSFGLPASSLTPVHRPAMDMSSITPQMMHYQQRQQHLQLPENGGAFGMDFGKVHGRQHVQQQQVLPFGVERGGATAGMLSFGGVGGVSMPEGGASNYLEFRGW
ncbi:meiosis-specific transcription factor ndt80 [Phlyctochytrium planicorne]|nr:meiosis-specific transcription factor ndt80 [Phlyctochytrium planicorne]